MAKIKPATCPKCAARQARDEIKQSLGRFGGPKDEQQAEHAVDEALRVLRRDYYREVAEMAFKLATEIVYGRISSSEEFDRWINDTTSTESGCQRVIITHKARIGLLASDNESAYQDDFGEAPPSVEAQMSWAMRADIYERLAASGLPADLFDD